MCGSCWVHQSHHYKYLSLKQIFVIGARLADSVSNPIINSENLCVGLAAQLGSIIHPMLQRYFMSEFPFQEIVASWQDGAGWAPL
jgi:uncharacterized membrane protein YbjE (DUF340 family)